MRFFLSGFLGERAVAFLENLHFPLAAREDAVVVGQAVFQGLVDGGAGVLLDAVEDIHLLLLGQVYDDRSLSRPGVHGKACSGRKEA